MNASSRPQNFCSLWLVLSVVFLSMGCQNNKVVENGKLVKMNYTLTVDGAVVDSSVNKTPLEFVHGGGQIIPGLEEQIVGLKVGEKKHITLAPENGYGAINPKAQQKVPKKAFGDVSQLKVGMTVNGQNGGRPVQAKVVSIGSKDITLDFNHPLAGKTLDFDIEIMAIEKASTPPTVPQTAEPEKKR
ncbi:MAG: Trigger factor [Elusimicrobia bacterium]|nr:Trigger factor [Elusimicrobiota bacterium]